jgi:hypothetical protein
MQPWGDLLGEDHILVMGMPKCGKSPYAAKLVRRARRVVFWDAGGSWSGEGEPVTAADLAEFPELLAGKVCRLVVIPTEDKAGIAAEFSQVVQACRDAAQLGGLVLVIDEVGDLRAATEELNGLHRNGHKAGIATVSCSPCCTDFPKRMRDTATRVFSFYQKAADDVATLDREYGGSFGTKAAAWRYPAPPVAWRSPTLH